MYVYKYNQEYNISNLDSGGAEGHPDEGATFPDGGLRQQGPKAETEFLGGAGSPLHQIRGYFAIPWGGGGGNFRWSHGQRPLQGNYATSSSTFDVYITKQACLQNLPTLRCKSL